MTRTRPILRLSGRIAAFGLAVFLLDAAAGGGLRRLYFGLREGKTYQVAYAMDKARQPLLIFGSSRAYTHYVPGILSTRLGLDAYNAGHDVGGILYETALLRAVLARCRPRTILLDFSPGDLSSVQPDRQILSALLPFSKSHPEIRGILLRRGPLERLKLLSRIYPFNSELLSLLLAAKTPWKSDRGYVGLEGAWTRPIEDPPAALTGAVVPELASRFREFVALCRKNGVSLTIVVSPIYCALDKATPSMAAAGDICREAGILFLDFSRDERFAERPELFRDPHHLNAGGAELFSGILADTLAADRASRAAREANVVPASGK